MDRQRLAAALVFMLTGAVLLCIFGWLRWGEALQPQPAISPAVKITKLSKPDCIDRSVGALHKRPVMHPISYRVKVPQNYAADRSWPLAVVLPAAGLSASMVEWHAGLTATLTARGFIVAYVASSGRLSTRTLQLYSKVPEQVSLDFCVDTDQVLWLGHSNGATASVALALGKVVSRAVV